MNHYNRKDNLPDVFTKEYKFLHEKHSVRSNAIYGQFLISRMIDMIICCEDLSEIPNDKIKLIISEIGEFRNFNHPSGYYNIKCSDELLFILNKLRTNIYCENLNNKIEIKFLAKIANILWQTEISYGQN